MFQCIIGVGYASVVVCCCVEADVETVDLASFDSAVIASTMKKYLRELPNPVIPEEFYTKFIDAASEWNMLGLF